MAEGALQVARPVARRKFAPKTKSGCRTCKIRRIKCDETKPSCKRCTSTGRKCDGYDASPPSDSSSTSSSPRETLPVALITGVASDALENRTFNFFRVKTVPGLSGCFQDITWDRTVLQVAHSEPAVRYAVNALGALHEELFLRRKTRQDSQSLVVDCRTSFPIKQYSKALRELHKLMESDNAPLDVVLLCSMVFMHIESLQESFLPALIHLENAINLVRTRATSGREPVDDGIVQALRRMDVQGSLYLGTRIPGLPDYGRDNELPSSFRTLAHARDVTAAWTCQLLHFCRTEADHHKYMSPGNVPLETYATAHYFEQKSLELEQLLVSFASTARKHLAVRDQHGLDMLRSRAKMNRILAACSTYTEMTAFDRFRDEMAEILTMCEAKFSSEDLDEILISASLDEGLVTPLSFVASTCRDSRLRRRAVALIDDLAGAEVAWYVEVMARISEAVQEYEEAVTDEENPTCEDIPEWRRVHGSGLSDWAITTTKTTAQAHFRSRPNGSDGEWLDEQVLIEFRTKMSQNGIQEFYNNSLPALTILYPPFEVLESLQNASGPASQPETLMSTLPFHTGSWIGKPG